MVGALKIAETTARRLLETRIEDRPVLSSWDALGDYLQAAMAHSPVEQVRVLFLNAKNLGATAIILVHNHPSGDPSPSSQDIRLTRDLIEAGRHMKITVHDHVIVGARGRTSLKASGLL